MAVYHHLSHALRIMRDQPNYRSWGPLIDQLPEPEQSEVRNWLRVEARKRQLFEKYRPHERAVR